MLDTLTTAVPAPSPEQEPGPRDVMALRLQLTAATLALIVFVIALGALAGWLFHISALTTLLPFLPTMPADVSAGLLLSAAALWLYRASPERQSVVTLRLTAGMAGCLALGTLIAHVTGWDPWHQWLTADGQAAASGRLAISWALGIVAFNAAILADPKSEGRGLSQSLAAVAVVLAILGGVGDVFGLEPASAPGQLGLMAPPTAVALLLLGLAFLFTRPDRGVMDVAIDAGAGGIATRQLLPVVAVLPPLLAWLSWQGVRAGLYEPAFAMTLFVTMTVTALSLAVLAGGRMLRGFDQQRAAAEAQQTHSEERLRRAVTDAPIPMIIHDGDRILHMSRGWIELSGYLLAETPTIAAWCAKAQPDRLPRLAADVEALGRLRETASGGEQAVRTRTGDTRVWEFSSTPLSSPDAGRLFVTMATDITERKQAAADLHRVNEGLELRIAERTAELTRANDALRRQSDQLKEQATLLDLVRDGILVRDLYGTVIYWSAGAADMYGWSREEALGRVSHQLLQAEYPRPLPDIEQQVMQSGDWEGEVTQRTRDGGRLRVASRWTLTRTDRGTPEGFLEVNRDITARKRAEDSLRDSEARFRAVAETAIEGIISVDESGTIRYWNPGAERIFGQPAAEAVGQPLASAMPDPLLATSRLPAAAGDAGSTFETLGRRADGSECPLELSLSTWTSTGGERLFTAIVRDITERKTAERALEAKADELARSNQELEQFAYVASHDLQEPLRMVSNYTQLLARRYKDHLDADANEFIDFAVDGAKRMQDLIHDLLQYARVGTRGKAFRPMPAEGIVADALANLSGAVDEARAEITIDPLPTIWCDGSQMAQVFQNLIANAVKFRRPGERPAVHIRAAHAPHAWTISVTDNGIGIDAKYHDRIFQMFQRLHARSDYPGTGIGLALCKKIVERHGGRIRVESPPGAGTTFSFTVPDQPVAHT